ncbi:hypothetical protein BU16DRAFT_560778 [Lophium mytilinum]|uniref:F-box domain-containing protein n=1 Tax=Lophium mytilinum TaxID=390894 RepID=A0A6A6QVJ4_9PEZI|nr:hypothetical protein BU16DRAFT_560778 [Lophium mytilinum]
MAQTIGPTPRPGSAFSRLSADIKLEVFDFVRSKIDQGISRLVSREWNQLMKPWMWRSFTTSMRGATFTDLEALADERNDCLHDIRELSIYRRYSESGSSGPGYHPNFQHLMDLLNDDQLLDFKSDKEFSMSSWDLLDIEDQASWITDHGRFVTSARHALRSLRVYVRDMPNEIEYNRATHKVETACSRLFISSGSLLRDLEICGEPFTSIDSSIDSILLNHVPRTLKSLSFRDIHFYSQDHELLRTINIATLQSLELSSCTGTVTFVFALAASFGQSGSQLKVLTVRNTNEMFRPDHGFHTALDSLLSSSTGLEVFEFNDALCDSLNWEESLRSHQKSLKSLLIAGDLMGMVTDPWSAELVEKVLDTCPHVEQFAYALLDPWLGWVQNYELPFSFGMHNSPDAPTVVSTKCLM